MENFQIHPIGKFHVSEKGSFVEVDSKYHNGLKGLEGFGNLLVLWWFSDFDNPEVRSVLEMPEPYKKGPKTMGVFATRSPVRPNLIGVTVVDVLDIDFEQGRIVVPYTDANNQTPILDIKPYTPSEDRVEEVQVPEWCRHWPKSVETSGDFDWEREFNF